MKKIDKVVLRETGYIAVWTLIFSLLMQAVFLVIGKYDIRVLFGNLLSAFIAVSNFFIMGISLTKALEKDEKEAKQTMKVSSTLRNLFMFVLLVVGIVFDSAFNIVAVILPLFFPRVAITIRPFIDKNYRNSVTAAGEEAPAENGSAAEEDISEESKGE
ncbi:MAG: hypothetical protein E7587_03985 [Ruminococcaceae bacterium]|nr:hypothetical protein [Oscillospiraceae bacterium]